MRYFFLLEKPQKKKVNKKENGLTPFSAFLGWRHPWKPKQKNGERCGTLSKFRAKLACKKYISLNTN